VGVAGGGRQVKANGRAEAAPTQLALPLPIPAAPTLRELDSWERLVADYASTGMAIAEHPMSLLRAGMSDGVLKSAELDRLPHEARVEVAGMVVARQRPATANGVVFMLLEDEVGTVNVVVPPPIYRRDRLAVRTASFALVRGRLERREEVMNVVAATIRPLSTPDRVTADVKHIEPPVERETGRRGRDAADLEAVMPAAHSFGRRGR
jgi:error-prone DNA polymerase